MRSGRDRSGKVGETAPARESNFTPCPRHNVGVSACAYLTLDGNSTPPGVRRVPLGRQPCEKFEEGGGTRGNVASNFLTDYFHLYPLYLFLKKESSSFLRILNFLWKEWILMRGSRFEEWILRKTCISETWRG